MNTDSQGGLGLLVLAALVLVLIVDTFPSQRRGALLALLSASGVILLLALSL